MPPDPQDCATQIVRRTRIVRRRKLCAARKLLAVVKVTKKTLQKGEGEVKKRLKNKKSLQNV